MSELIEKQKDQAVLATLNVDRALKISTGLTLVIHRQLLLLAQKTGIAVEDMDREFIVSQLCKVKLD